MIEIIGVIRGGNYKCLQRVQLFREYLGTQQHLRVIKIFRIVIKYNMNISKRDSRDELERSHLAMPLRFKIFMQDSSMYSSSDKRVAVSICTTTTTIINFASKKNHAANLIDGTVVLRIAGYTYVPRSSRTRKPLPLGFLLFPA